jgi:hypothetical protein
LLGDYDALPDIDVIAEGIEAALKELLTVARGKPARPRRTPASAERRGTDGAGTNGGPTPLIPPGHSRAKRGPAADMRAKRSRGTSKARKPSED